MITNQIRSLDIISGDDTLIEVVLHKNARLHILFFNQSLLILARSSTIFEN